MHNDTCLSATLSQPARPVVALMAGAAGLAVASIYYNQPMLGILARAFHVDTAAVSQIAVLTQVGYALGLVLLAPLGDLFERRGLIGLSFAGLALALGLAAFSRGLGCLLAASLLVGMLATVAQQIVPMAAHLAAPERRGSVVGTVMAGLLAGILLSRTLSGLVSQYGDWRQVFGAAAVASLAMGAGLMVWLPRVEPAARLSYPAMLASLVGLARRYGTLRRAGLVQGLLFAGFVAFWAGLAVYLERPPFSQGSAVAGLLGLVGVAGVLAAPLAGKLADKGAKGRLVLWGAGAVAASFGLLGLFQGSWLALIGAILLMDVGIQAALVANQTRVYALDEGARSRLNTVFTTMMFTGGALGTALGAHVLAAFGWTGLCLLGAGLGIAALVVEFAWGRQAA